ncbi:MAG TPA: preprotein translocase subunit YajC [Gemmatimonadaceae bacterium]|nr:preprotein translocase subunit YajC [Gemmatimonadaceae bacterium]
MMTTSTPLALILAQAGGGAGGSSLMPFLIQFVLIIAIIYFIMVRPQQKQRQKHEESLKALKRGDEVVTTGGIIGEVVHIRETSKDGGANRLDDRVTIRSGESKLVVERGRIAKIVGTTQSSSANSPST